MEDCCDFIQWLGVDMSMQILMCLDNPTDLVRVSAVSTAWRHFGEFTNQSLHLGVQTSRATRELLELGSKKSSNEPSLNELELEPEPKNKLV
ncbi:putative F-box-like domain superfamily protein [Helianthus annuus]|nr:putative F-box-like domain superfamily protein [Helianthus annuus]KAJ0658217.1 putative F-box-like domain superfamily protein [Helianthus annuus]KAJ0661889.1 putative F-box-like domain superfamily protein [Helianthus annuus]